MTIYTLYWIHNPEHTDPYSQGYVGLTKRDPQERFREHLQRKGLDGVEFTILSQGNESDISALEESYRPESHIGWNTARGGLHGGRPTGIHTSGWTHSEESKQKRSDMVSGENNPQYGKPTSDAQKRAVRIANSVPKPHVSENMKQRHKQGLVPKFAGKDNGMSRRVIVGNEIYDTVTEAAKAHSVSRVTATRRLRVDTFPEWNYEQERTEG